LTVDYASMTEDQIVERLEALLTVAIATRDERCAGERIVQAAYQHHVADLSVEEGNAQAALESTSEPALEKNDATTDRITCILPRDQSWIPTHF
jgi:hypothetical protein